MALSPRLANAAASLAADDVAALLNNGYLRIYTGPQPANANTAITTQTLLAELRWNAVAFGASVNGVATANAITSAIAGAVGTAAWFRALKADGVTAVFDGSVGAAGCDVNLSTVAIVIGLIVALSAFTYTQAES